MKSDRTKAKKRALVKKWKADPVAYIKDVFGVDLLGGPWAREGQRAYQAEIAMSIVENQQTYVVTGNGVGKDFILGRMVPWWVSTRQGIAITTAPKDEQVRKILWGEIRSAVARSTVPFGGDLKPAAPYWTFGPKWYATGLVAKDENSFQGFHGAEVFVVGDEAAGIPEFIWPAMFGCAVGANDRFALIGNPTCSPVHPFAKGAMAKDVPGKKLTIRVKGTETPNYTSGEELIPGLQTVQGVERIVSKYGRTSAITNARVHAQFPSAGSDSVIGYEHIGPARERWARGVRGEPDAACRAGGDVARYGDDMTAFAWMRGCEAHAAMEDAKGQLSQPAVEAFFGRRCREIGAASISIDGGAMGAGPIDYLRENRARYELHRSFGVYEVLFGARAHDDQEFADRRTEMWWRLREWLETEGSMDPDEDLEEELMAPTYSYVGRRLKMEKKEDTKARLGRSPDRADALALAVAGHIGQPLTLLGTGAQGPTGAASPTQRKGRYFDDDDDDDRGSSPFDGMHTTGGFDW